MRQKSVNDLAHEWWAMGLRGLASLVACVVFVATPLPHAENLLRVFGGYLLTDGVVVLALTGFEVRRGKSWAKSALNGFLGVVFGITNLIGSGPVALRTDFVAIRTFLMGVSGIITAGRLHVAPSERLLAWLLLSSGIGSVIFSLMISVGPLLMAHLLDQFALVAAAYTFCLSILLLTISFWLLKLNRKTATAAAA